MDTLIAFLLGVVATAALAIALFFLRFYRRAGERLFLIFSVAFALLAVQWAASAFVPEGEHAHVPFLIRLLAFACIIWGIAHKNRAARAGAAGAAAR